MTKPGFEPRIIEMKVGRSNHFTIRSLRSKINAMKKYFISGSVKSFVDDL